MRKLFKILVSLLCFMPLFIGARTFESEKNLANKYMKDNFEGDYSRYIVSENTKYGFSEKGIFIVPGFDKGGFINKYEYDLSKDLEDVNDSSWLYDINGYWSLTGDDNNAYVVGKTTYPKTNSFNNRVVQYVRNKTRVTGKGTYSNPWVIDKSYQVIIKANRENLVDSIYYNNDKCGEDRCETNVLMNRDAIFYINFKDGYEFDTSEDGTNLCNASNYTSSSRKLVIPNVIDDIECFFKIKEKEYKITFNANGGVLSGENNKNVTYTKSYGVLPEPTREGYGFAGWYTEAEGGNKIDSSSILDTPEDKILYAHWDAKNYIVIFDGNGGTPSYSNKSVVYDSTYGSLPTASRTGYTFLGWYTTASGGTQVTSNTTVKITSTQTLYAHWRINAVTVTFVYSNGQANTTKSINYGDNYTLPASVTTLTCSSLDGWYDEYGNKITNSTVMNKTTAHTVTAKWNSSMVTATASNVSNYFSYTGRYSIATDSGGWYIKFLSSGTLKMNACMLVDLSLVGGGGGGGGGRFDGPACQAGAGGSAGYTKNYNNVTLQNVSYNITIGSGGSGGGNGGVGGTGGTTRFGSYSASGGGGSNNGSARSSGGSGGGASGNTGTYIAGGNGGSNGGNGANTGNGGGSGQGSTTRGFASTSYTLFSGGGGGGTLAYTITGYYNSQPGGYGGSGGGARGGGNNSASGASAAANTGGGGGGGGCYCYSMYSGTGYGGGSGGSGIVLMRNKR